jgi:N-acetylornithine carbamoyltransferase
MQTDLRGRDLIGDLDFSKEEVETVLDVAFDLKRKRALGELHPYLRDKVLAMLFFFSSTRTRGSFEAGMAQLGGHAAFIESKSTQIAHGDTPVEIGEIFGRYFDGIAIRHVDWKVGNKYINEVAKYSRSPILNMQCEIYHPFQCLADLMTIMEKKGRDLAGEDGRLMGLCGFIPKADLRAAIADPANAALRHGRGAGAPAGIQAHA